MERPALYSSVEKTNGAKLSRLLIDGGTKVLRTVFNSYHSPGNLMAVLNSNYLILNGLLKKKVLYKSQWDQLFPPGGDAPDSNTFDITLLFLLLTNICGLAPPPLGWHTKPPPGDTSLEANLARVNLEDSPSISTTVTFEAIDQDRDISNDSCPWEFEHRTNGGFLLGDPIDISSEKLSSVVPFWEAGFISVLNEETALMSSP
ncbi:hypothetical protein OS493_002302 [Desmophyllum pertusum]|uniref:DZIP3-like HEPN domain-containing protein n=1 Tax=Desmophyllum pertusum TaxID=174260 RepID=A0A9W9YSR4_9CNID|nr:hypothetical protein OS493_002302 [Desmophyllum pertusum]